MGAGRKTESYTGLHSPSSVAGPSSPFLNLPPEQLAAVIFGCDHATYNECVTQFLFGLRASHISYVKNVRPGMPLFLFNYNDRKLHGIFEADSYGEMNINPYAWTDGKQKTQFPAQTRVRVRCQCAPLTENIYKQALAANYVNNAQRHILFELNHVQTDKLISLYMRNSLSVSRHVVGLQCGSMSADKGEDVDSWMKHKKPQTAALKAWENAVAFTSAQNFGYSILEYKGAISPGQRYDDPSNRVESSSQDFLQKDVEPMPGDSVNWNAAAASSSFNTDEALEEHTKSEKHHERTEKLEIVETLKQQKFKGKQIYGDRKVEDLNLQEHAYNEPSNSDTLDVPESSCSSLVEWESLAQEQCLQEQIMLREDREQLKEKLEALDISVDKAISKNLERSALAIFQMRQDRIKTRHLMDEAMTREELLKELEELRKKNATLEYAQQMLDVLKSDMARMFSDLAALKADMARVLKVEVLSKSGKEGGLMPYSTE